MAVFVGDDAIVEAAVTIGGLPHLLQGDVHRVSCVEGIAQLGAHHIGDHHGRYVDDAGSAAHARGGARLVVHHDDADGARVLGSFHLDHKGAVATVDQRETAADLCCVHQTAATVLGRREVILHDHQITGQGHQRRTRTEARIGTKIASCQGAWSVHREVVRQRGAGPIVHLHAPILAIGRRAEIGIVGAPAILSFGDYLVETFTATVVVVLLEVAALLIEAVAVPDVVHQVVPEEEVGDRSILIGRRGLAEVQREVEVEGRTTVRAVSRQVDVVHILTGQHVVATGDGVFRPINAIHIVPAEGRGQGIGGVHHQGARTVARTFHRAIEHAIPSASCEVLQRQFRFPCNGLRAVCMALVGELTVHDVVVLPEQGTGVGIYGQVPPVGVVHRADGEVPGEANSAFRSGLVEQPGLDRSVGDPGRREFHHAFG